MTSTPERQSYDSSFIDDNEVRYEPLGVFNTPDAGLMQRSYSLEELDENIVDFENLTHDLEGQDSDLHVNSFFDTEAIEEDDSSFQ